MGTSSGNMRVRGTANRSTVHRLIVAALSMAGCATLVAWGCSSPPTFEFDELDIAPAQEELAEFSLGEYRIPIPVTKYEADKRPIHRNSFQLEFELFALVSPHEKSQITEAWDRHQGKIRDRVIRICRNSSLDELQEPELATLKGRLLDALAPQLGENEVRQLLITEIVSHEI
jgi:flagellar basal body-associated protein FliL